MMLLIINSVIVLGLVWIVGVLLADAFTKRGNTQRQELNRSRLPRWARSS